MERKIIGGIGLYYDGGIEILDIEHGINDKIKFRYNFGTPGRTCTALIKYDKQGEPYFNTAGNRYYMNEITRTA